jgi:hypothetical protein
MRTGDVQHAMEILQSFFKSIQYYSLIANVKYYQTIFHIIFCLVGADCRSEVRLADGRIDSLVETRDFVYCFEFKLNGSAKEALEQINTKEYLLPWTGSGKKLFKVGVNFDMKNRVIVEWVVEG